MSREYELAEIYLDLRGRALALTRELLDPETASEGRVLALLMETGYPEAIATLVGLGDGTTSMYFSNGGGTIGAASIRRLPRRRGAGSSWPRSCSTSFPRRPATCSFPTRARRSSSR